MNIIGKTDFFVFLMTQMKGKGTYGLLVTVMLLLMTVACTQTPVEYTPGMVIPERELAKLDVDSFFVCREIPDEIFDFMQGRSYKEGCNVPREDLRYLLILHRNIEGQVIVGELVVNKAISADILEIMRQLFEESYPIERVRLIDYFDADDRIAMEANNTSCFNWRAQTGSPAFSKHAMGMAIDINPLYNPYYKFPYVNQTIEPAIGEPYMDRMWEFPYKIEEDDACCRLFTEHGFKWGGNWNSLRDYQHFEK